MCLPFGLILGRSICDIKWLFGNCGNAFRLRRLAQSGCLRSGLILVCCIFPATSRKSGTCEMLKRISPAQARTKRGPGDLAMRSLTETLPTDCQQSSGREILCRDLIKRSCQEISHRDLVQEVLPLAKTPLTEICEEILPRCLVHESCHRALVERSCTDFLPGDLLRRSCTQIW